jgi:hypothetical protein
MVIIPTQVMAITLLGLYKSMIKCTLRLSCKTTRQSNLFIHLYLTTIALTWLSAKGNEFYGGQFSKRKACLSQNSIISPFCTFPGEFRVLSEVSEEATWGWVEGIWGYQLSTDSHVCSLHIVSSHLDIPSAEQVDRLLHFRTAAPFPQTH